MFDDFLYNVYRSIRLDKNLYKEPKNFENISLLYAAIIVILCGLAGGLAKNSVVQFSNLGLIPTTNIIVSAFANIFPWLIWTFLIYVIGVKIFPETKTSADFKKILITVGYAQAPCLFRFFTYIPEIIVPIILLTEIWFLVSLIVGVREILNYNSSIKSTGVVALTLLIITIFGFLLLSQQFN